MTVTTNEIPIKAQAKASTERGAFKFYLNVLSTIMTVLVVMVAAVAMVLAVATRFSPAGQYGQYRVFGHPVMIVVSGSMSPTIKTGDLIVDNAVNPTQARHLRVGQIITFRDSPTSKVVITHRIVRVTSVDGTVAYITKGDANNAADANPRPAADVLGVFSYTVNRGGYILNSLHRPLVLGLLLVSPILWFIGAPLFRAARQMDDKRAGQKPAAPAGEKEANEP
jgi:signal peptidase